MHFGVVGDVHGDFDALARVVARHGNAVGFWLSVGDVASDDMRYPDPVAPLYWIEGNNEDFDFIAREPRVGKLRFLANGTCTIVEGVGVAALGGTFAPTWYDTPAADLPYPGSPRTSRAIRDDKRRHFVREQVDACKAMRSVDVFLTHEAPRPFIVQAGARRLDAGKTPINEVLAEMRPRLHFFGHHHRFSEAIRAGVPSIGLDVVSRSHVIVDADSWTWTRIDTI